MLALMKGGGSRWHIFRGKDARDFCIGLIMIGRWSVDVKLRAHGVEDCVLWLTNQGGAILILENENIPDVVAQAIYKRAVAAAEESERKKHGAEQS